MPPTTSDLLQWRQMLYRGENTPIEFQLSVVEDLLRRDGIIAGGTNHATRADLMDFMGVPNA